MNAALLIFKILPSAVWEKARRDGVFRGAGVDLADGYIHFSTAEQVAETAAKHFSAQGDLVLLAVDVNALNSSDLKWETSRGGALFPHLYCDLPVSAVRWAKTLPWDGARHVFPELT